MLACAQIFAKTNFQQSQNSEKTHRGHCDHNPVHQRASDSFRCSALKATQDASGLAESKKGEQPPWRILCQGSNRNKNRGGYSKIGKNGEQTVHLRKQRDNQLDDQKRPEMAVQKKCSRD